MTHPATPAPEPRHRLSRDDWASLARLGAWARNAPPGPARDVAMAAATAAARQCRHNGIGWDKIAIALGITRAELRQWGSDTSPTKPRNPVSEQPRVHRTTRQGQGQGPVSLLLVAGTAKINHNDFAGEIAGIRRALAPIGTHDIVERFDIEIGDIRVGLDHHRPAVLHVAAHCDLGTLYLCLDGITTAVPLTDLHRTIGGAAARPILTVFNICHSENPRHRRRRTRP